MRLLGAGAAGEPTLAARLGESADAGDIGGALGHRDDTARVEQVESVAGLDALIIGRQRQERVAAQERLAFGFGIGEVAQQRIGVGAEREREVRLDARGAISVTERAAYIGRVRALAKACCEGWLAGEAA